MLKNILKYNLLQFKLALLCSFTISTGFLYCLMFLGSSTKYNLFDKLLMPPAFGLFIGIALIICLIITLLFNALSTQYFFNKHFALFINEYHFQIVYINSSKWQLTKLALSGYIFKANINVQRLNEEQFSITFIPPDHSAEQIKTLNCTCKDLKKLGATKLIEDINTLIQIDTLSE